MTGTGYTVASVDQLLGPKPPRRREAENITPRATMQTIDNTDRDDSVAKRADHIRTVRFRDQVNPPADGGQSSGEAHASSTKQDFQVQNKSNPSVSEAVLSIKDTKKNAQVTFEAPASRVKQELGEVKLPLLHQERIAKTTINTSFVPAGTTALQRNASTSRRPSLKNTEVTEIYFSPVDVNRSLISFSEPIENLEEVLTPTQASYDETHKALGEPEEAMHRISQPEIDQRLTLTPEQVDRLVTALAKSPLLHVHVSKQWWDDIPDDSTVSSSPPSTPSLTDESGSASGSSTIYSQPNRAFVTEQRSPSITQAILEEEFAQEYPDHPKAKRPPTAGRLASTRFGGIALTDPKVHGCPIRFISRDYRLGANVLQVGSCSFLNVPYGASIHSVLRVEPPSNIDINCRIMLQVVNQVVERKTGKKIYLLVAELDVTESFTRAALTELAAYAEVPLDAIRLITPAEKPRKASADIDWCALADELQISCSIADVVEAAASSFANLSADFCSMQTLTLMSELERLKAQHQDFLVVRPTGHHQNGMLSGVHVPWTSQHLDQVLHEPAPNSARGEVSKAARILRERVINAVTGGCVTGQSFDTKIWWGDQMRLLHCVPLMEGTGAKPAAWIAFLSDLGRYEGCLAQAFVNLNGFKGV